MRFPWRRSPRRTLLLGVAAMGVLLWGAVSQFDIPREQLLDSLVAMLLVLLAVIALAALSVALWVGLRRLLGREHREGAAPGASAERRSPRPPEKPPGTA